MAIFDDRVIILSPGAWGSGFQRTKTACEQQGLLLKWSSKEEKSSEKILLLLKSDAELTIAELAKQLKKFKKVNG